jgi:hypothetical protein
MELSGYTQLGDELGLGPVLANFTRTRIGPRIARSSSAESSGACCVQGALLLE